MRQVKTILSTIMVGCTLSLTFWYFVNSTLPTEAFGASSDRTQPQRDRVQSPHIDRAQPATAVSSTPNTASSAVTFGPIEVITTVATTRDTGKLARELALAMDIPADDIDSAVLMCDDASSVCTDPAAVAVMGLAPGTWFPTHGTSFALLSTGRVTDMLATAADQTSQLPNVAQQSAMEVLNGLKNSQGGDLVRLHLSLSAPQDAKCMALDFTFYTVDLRYTSTSPRAPSDPFGDIFTAQLDESNLSLEKATISAPGNVAFNKQGQVVATNTMSPSGVYAALRSPPGSNIPGVFPLLQMRHTVTGGQQVDLYLSIQDIGDSYANSAVALDNFAWIRDTSSSSCLPKPGHSGDRDGDGLPNGWEEYGTYVRDGAGTLHHLDLKALRADPDVKDVFVEIDAMQPLTTDGSGFDPKPLAQSVAYIVNAFARAPVDEIYPGTPNTPKQYKGIHLHVDHGQDTPPQWQTVGNDAPQLWAMLTGGNVLPDPAQPYLCGDECSVSLDPLWNSIDQIKRSNFAIERSPVFHYALFAHRLAECTDAMINSSLIFCFDSEQISGISRNILPTVHGASDFVLSLGDPYWSETGDIMAMQQAGTFMHELGHNLGLNHYGTIENDDPEQVLAKPNHLSVMNYLYQTNGLVVSEPTFLFDYSRYNMVVLDENSLSETSGIYLAKSGVAVTYTIGVRRYCIPDDDVEVTVDATTVNWNCDAILTDGVQYNITGDRIGTKPILSTLVALNEWDRLVYTGGMLNRQRSMLRPFSTDRLSYNSSDNQDREASLAGPLPEVDFEPTVQRRLIMPQAIITSAADRLVREELTPAKDKLIPRYVAPLQQPQIPQNDSGDRFESLCDWYLNNLAPLFEASRDVFLDSIR